MAVSTLELVEESQARSDLTRRDASAIVQILARALEGATGELVTRDHLDARLAELRAELKGGIAALRAELKGDGAGLRAEMKSDKSEMHSLIRSQTQWFVGALIAVAGIAVAIIKLVPNAA